MRIIVYSCAVYEIGGIDTFNYNLIKRLSRKHEIVFVYHASYSQQQLDAIKQYAQVYKIGTNTIHADICIWSTAWGHRPYKQIIAQKHIQVVHADYAAYIDCWAFKYEPLECINKHITVSKNSQSSLKKVYHIDSDVIYNLLDDEIAVNKNITKPLIFITASRISKEKGIERIIKLARIFKEHNKRFIWLVYGDTSTKYFDTIKTQINDIPELLFVGVKLHLAEEIANADYLVQLSDTEGFPYSPYEALQVGTACIVTDYKSAKEQIKDGYNGYILDMDLKNVNVDKIFGKIPRFKFQEKSNEGDWERLFEDIEPIAQLPPIVETNDYIPSPTHECVKIHNIAEGIRLLPVNFDWQAYAIAQGHKEWSRHTALSYYINSKILHS